MFPVTPLFGGRVRAWRVERPRRWLIAVRGRVVASLPEEVPLGALLSVMHQVDPGPEK